MQIPGRIAVTSGNTTASHLSGMEVKAGQQRLRGELEPSLGVECLSLVFLGLSLSVCFCSCVLSNRLMAERLQRRPVDGLHFHCEQ